MRECRGGSEDDLAGRLQNSLLGEVSGVGLSWSRQVTRDARAGCSASIQPVGASMLSLLQA